MNERIGKLAEQASSGACYDEPGSVTLYNDEIEKFAELIVRKCLMLCDQVDLIGADDCIDKIKDYFEVDQ